MPKFSSKERVTQSLYCNSPKEFLEAGKKRQAGGVAQQAGTDEVKDLHAKAVALKELVADLTLEDRSVKKTRAGLQATRRR